MLKRCLRCMALTDGHEQCSICGCRFAELRQDANALPAGTALRQYTVGALLLKRPFGLTYIAYDNENARKVVLNEHFNSDLHIRGDDRIQVTVQQGVSQRQIYASEDRLFMEWRFLQCFPEAPATVQIYEAFAANGTSYMTAEPIDGISISNLCRRSGGKIPWAAAVRWMLPVLETLQQMHEAGWLHGNIQPAVLYLCTDGRLRFIDCDLAFDYRQPEIKYMITNGHYSAPECFGKKGIGPGSDVYACAASLYYMITGVKPPHPFDRLIDSPIERPSAYCPKISPKAEAALLAAMELNPRKRTQTAAEFRRQLMSAL